MFAPPMLTLSSTLGISQRALLSNADDSIQNESIRSDDLSSFYPTSSIHTKTIANKSQVIQKSTSESESSSTPSSSEEMESDVENLMKSKETDGSSLCRVDDYCAEVFTISSEVPNNEYATGAEVYLKDSPVKDEPMESKSDGESEGEETEFYDTPTKISPQKDSLDTKSVSASIPFFECEESKYEPVKSAGFTHNGESGDETLSYGQEQSASESECKVIVRPMPNISHITALENYSFTFKSKSFESNNRLEPSMQMLEAIKFKEINNIEAQVKKNKHSGKVLTNQNKQPFEVKKSPQFGRGVPLKCIEYVASQVQEASPVTLNTLYYILFDRENVCQNVVSIDQAKEDILNFCGFPFEIGSPEFEKKQMELDNMQYSILYAVYSVLISNMTKTRSSLVAQLLKFLMKPSMSRCMPPSSENETPTEVPVIKNETVNAHLPVVMLKRLTEDEIKNAVELKEKPKERSSLISEGAAGICNTQKPTPSVVYHGNGNPLVAFPDKGAVGICSTQKPTPSVVYPGSGSPLKAFPDIASRIKKASKIIIFKLHALIYGARGAVRKVSDT